MADRVIREDYSKNNLRLFEKVKQGNQEALEEMISLNRPLAMREANRFYRAAFVEYRPSIGLEDIEQLALVGLWQAITVWEPDRGALSSLVIWKIKNEIREIFRTKLSYSLNTPIPGDSEEKTEQINMLPDMDAVDPELNAYSVQRCREYFDFMANHAKPEELERLKAYVYNFSPMPNRRTIQTAIFLGGQKPIVRAFREKWLSDRISYYPRVSYGSTGKSSSHSDPTALIAISRLEMTRSLENKLWNRYLKVDGDDGADPRQEEQNSGGKSVSLSNWDHFNASKKLCSDLGCQSWNINVCCPEMMTELCLPKKKLLESFDISESKLENNEISQDDIVELLAILDK